MAMAVGHKNDGAVALVFNGRDQAFKLVLGEKGDGGGWVAFGDEWFDGWHNTICRYYESRGDRTPFDGNVTPHNSE